MVPGGQNAGDSGGEARFGEAFDDGAVGGGPLGEQGHDVAVVVGPQVVAGQGPVGGVDVRARGGPDRGPDPGQDLVPAAHCAPPRPPGSPWSWVRLHQARNDSAGGAGASRVSVQALSGGGSRLIVSGRPPPPRLGPRPPRGARSPPG